MKKITLPYLKGFSTKTVSFAKKIFDELGLSLGDIGISTAEFNRRFLWGRNYKNNENYWINEQRLEGMGLLKQGMTDSLSLMAPNKNDFRYIIVDTSNFNEDTSGVADQLNAVDFGYLDIGDL